jgi:hypothetical protein
MWNDHFLNTALYSMSMSLSSSLKKFLCQSTSQPFVLAVSYRPESTDTDKLALSTLISKRKYPSHLHSYKE